MATLLFSFILCLLPSLTAWGPLQCRAVAVDGSTFSLDLHHRFSDKVRAWAESVSLDVEDWPAKGTIEYYRYLVAHDHANLRGRGLTELTLAGGNETHRFSALGFLHYSIVDLGTPNVKFLVALDSGSDLFWVPCDCKNCSPTYNDAYNLKLNIFSSSSSSTSKKVPCSSSLCDRKASCSAPTDACPYRVRYLSANTSTAGILLEDVLHFITNDARKDPVQVNVTLGCGQVQTGSFLRTAALNGILGLGLEKISVPSTLAAAGLTADSFSMCFNSNGTGRIAFGDKGEADQNTTRFLVSSEHPTYNINVTGMLVGGNYLDVSFSAIFDTGTSFTILSKAAYTLLATSFDASVRDQRVDLGSDFLFDFCYNLGPVLKKVIYPRVGLKLDGGKVFPALHPLVVFYVEEEKTYIYCLGVLGTTSEINIIGQNFMNGLNIVFDREKHVLGWKESDCYSVGNQSLSSENAPKPSPQPPVTAAQSGSSAPEGAKPPTGGAGDVRSAALVLSFLLCHLFVLLTFSL